MDRSPSSSASEPRLREKVKETLRGLRALLRALHDEARHPGRPPSFHAADSPFWQDPKSR